MNQPTDANGRQQTPTDAPRPLRETVAEAMTEQRLNGHGDVLQTADAAIAAMVTALLSETAVEAGAEAVYEVYPDWVQVTKSGIFGPLHRRLPWEESPTDSKRGKRRAATLALKAALRRIGAVEGETK